MYTTSEVNSASTLAEYKEKAADYGFEIVESGVSSTADIPLAADSLLEQVDCLNNLTDNTVVASLPLILSKANAKNIPVFGSEIEQVKIGCLAAMGLDYVDLGKQTGRMAAEVLKGEKKASELNLKSSRKLLSTETPKSLRISGSHSRRTSPRMQKNYSLRSPSNNSNRHNVRKSGKAFHPLCRTLHQNVTVKVTVQQS